MSWEGPQNSGGRGLDFFFFFALNVGTFPSWGWQYAERDEVCRAEGPGHSKVDL